MPSSASTSATTSLVEKCDQLADAADTLLDDCEVSNAALNQVTDLARQLERQTLRLYEAQAKLELEREAVSRRLFWSQFLPARFALGFVGKR